MDKYSRKETIRDLYNSIYRTTYCSQHDEYMVKSAIKNDSELLNLSTGASALLSLVCKKGYYTIVKILLENGANANGAYIKEGDETDETMVIPESTPIEIAYKEYKDWNTCYEQTAFDRDSYKAIIEILIQYGADETKLSKYEYESDGYVSEKLPLLCGAASGDLEKISKYLAKGRNVVDFRYCYEKTALMYACKNGKFEAALMLISAGADINAKDSIGKTVLNYAAEGGNTKIMELLIARGAKA